VPATLVDSRFGHQSLSKLLGCLSLLALLAGIAPAEISSRHPRIHVRHDQAEVGQGISVSELRRRALDAAYAKWRQPLSGGGAAAIVERAARYLEGGDAGELSAVRDFLLSHTFSYREHDVGGFLAGAEMATALDWVYDGLSDADRRAAMANIVTTADSSRQFLERGGPDINHNYTYMALNTVATCGLVLWGEPAPYGETAREYLALARQFLEAPGRVLDTWQAREGAWAEGSHYTFHETLRNFVMMLQAYRSASDTDYFSQAAGRGGFAAAAGRFLIASTRPDFTFERTGDTSASRALVNRTVLLTVEALAAGLHEPDEAARLRSFADDLRQAYGSDDVVPAFQWGMRVFHDPTARRTPSYRTLPTGLRLGQGTSEHIVLRNGWSEDSTMITILGGDHFTDHQHFDKGHFLVYHRGGLAVDSGSYDGMYRPGEHPNEYAQRTLAHNCLLIHDPEQVFPKGYTNEGGQQVIRGEQHHEDWREYVAHRREEGLDTADVLAFDHAHDDFSYVRLDLRRAYGEKVRSYDRQFVYLPSAGVLLVYDRVVARRPGFEQRWLLHFQDAPIVDGKTPEPGETTYAGAARIEMQRQGRLDLGGRSFAYDGRLIVRTLVPASRVTRIVGGPGYEFWHPFEKRNYPPRRERETADARESGRWRMEVSPAEPRAEQNFLHSLSMGGAAGAAAGPVELLDSLPDALTGVVVPSSPVSRVVLFRSRAADMALRLEYTLSLETPAEHLVVEMPPGQDLDLLVEDRPPRPVRVNSQGVLAFADGVGGTRRIILRPR
jgi:hypothetical protein